MGTTLQEHLDRYLEACKGDDPAALLPLMHTEVVRSMGGKAKFLRTMAAVIDARRLNGNARGNAQGMTLEHIGPIQSSGPTYRLAFVQIRFPLFFGGKSILETVTPVVALSKDGEKTWIFLEANEDGVSLLMKAEGSKLKLPPRPEPELQMGAQEEVVAGIDAEFRKVMLGQATDGALRSTDPPASKAERALRAVFLERFKLMFQQILQRRLEKPWAGRHFETAWTHITKSFEAVEAAARVEELAEGRHTGAFKTGTSTIESQVTDLLTHLVPLLFSLYDTYLPNDASGWIARVDRILDTRVPEYRLAVDATRITIECDGFQLTGSPAGYLSLIGGLWGIARSKTLNETPCVRYVYELGRNMPRGDFLIRKAAEHLPERFVALAGALKAHGSRDATVEAELLLYQLLRNLEYSDLPQWPELIVELKSSFSEKTVARLDGYQDVPNSSATTHQAAIKKLAASKYLTSRNPFDRLLLVQRLHGHVHDTDSNLLRVLKIFSSFLPLLADKHPLVRDLMAETADLLAANLFYSRAYEQVLPLLTQLIDLGINLDINLARRWECSLVLGREEEARRDWERLQPMVRPWEPAPAQYAGLHTRYPNYDFWQLFGYLRMAQTHLQWAAGRDPCKYVVKKKTSVPKARRDQHRQTADEYVSVVLRKTEEFANTYNAFEVGPIFAELRVELARLKKENIYGRAAGRYVMHSQYVEHLVKEGPVRVTTASISRSGLFKKTEGRHYVLAADTASIDSPQPGDAMGFEYRVEGEPLSRGVQTTIQVFHAPPDSPSEARAPIANYEAISYVGMNNAFFWAFETDDDQRPGRWSIEMAIKAGETTAIPLTWNFEIAPARGQA